MGVFLSSVPSLVSVVLHEAKMLSTSARVRRRSKIFFMFIRPFLIFFVFLKITLSDLGKACSRNRLPYAARAFVGNVELYLGGKLGEFLVKNLLSALEQDNAALA